MAAALLPGVSQILRDHACEAEAFRALAKLHAQAVFSYLSMSFYFSQEKGFQKSVGSFFHHLAKEKLKAMQKLLQLQWDRGWFVIFSSALQPPQDEWGSALRGLEAAMTLERNLNLSFLELYELSMIYSDPQLCFFLQSLMEEEKKLIEEMEDRLALLCRLGYPLFPLSDDFIEKLLFKKIGGPSSPRYL